MAQSNQNVVKIVAAVLVVGVLAIGGFFFLKGDGGSAGSQTADSAPPADWGMSTPVSDGPGAPVEKLPPLPVGLTEMALGSPNAPVTLVEFASLTCGHCREFHVNRLPDLKEKYVDTGKLRIIMRDFPLDAYALRASMIAHCAGPDQYFAYVDTFFRQQAQWLTGDPMEGLERIANFAGMSSEDFTTCLDDKALSQKIVAAMQTTGDALTINSTPSFLIEGQTFSGTRPLKQYEDLIDAALERQGISIE